MILSVCLDPRLRFELTSAFCVFVLLFFFFFFTRFGETRLLFMYWSLNSNRKCWLFCSKQCISILFMDPQISLFSNFFIKNGSHGTIYTFKNYFATVFSIFSFQFQQNKFYPNRPLVLKIKEKHLTRLKPKILTYCVSKSTHSYLSNPLLNIIFQFMHAGKKKI